MFPHKNSFPNFVYSLNNKYNFVHVTQKVIHTGMCGPKPCYTIKL